MGNRSKRPKNIVKPNKQTVHKVSLSTSQTSLLRYSAPIPMAAEMEKYEVLCPGATDRILKIAEKSLKITGEQAAHRQKIETAVISSSNKVHMIGVITAAVITLAALCLAGFCIYMGHEFIGALLGGGGISSIVAAFIYGTRSNRQERENKWEKALQFKNEIQL